MTVTGASMNSDQVLEAARALCREGKFEEGIELFRNVVAADPKNAVAYNLLGMALDRTGKSTEALPCFDRAIALNPNFAVALSNKADALSALQRFREAIGFYNRALAADPESPLTWCNRSLALTEMAAAAMGTPSGKSPEATQLLRDSLESCTRALQIDPAMTEALLSKSRIHLMLDQPNDALDAAMLALDHGSEAAWHLFVESAIKLKRLSETDKLRNYLVRALNEGRCSPRSLFALSASLLLDPKTLLGEFIRSTLQVGKNSISPKEIISRPEFENVRTDPLLLIILESIFVHEERLEKFLTLMRRLLLHTARTEKAPPEFRNRTVGFAAALAQQCFLNDYVFHVSDSEAETLSALEGEISANLQSGKLPDAFIISVLGSYRALSHLPDVQLLNTGNWPESVERLIKQQVHEAEELRELRGTIKRVTNIQDDVSLAVRNQYEENPYPCWARHEPLPRRDNINEYFRNRFPGVSVEPVSDQPSILIAGCGTGHQIAGYSFYRDAKVLAVDLSLSSLSYAKMRMQTSALDNIEFGQADIMNIGGLAQRFDMIVSTGVLHHMRDPEAGWSNLVSLLTPNGLMAIALYSELARTQITATRKLIEEMKLQPVPADIRRFRQHVFNLPADDPLRKVSKWADFYSLSECRDLLFHVQEHRFTIPRIEAFLNKHRLRFLGFDLRESVRVAFRKFHGTDKGGNDLAAWDRFEQANPDSFDEMYVFWLQRA